MTKPVRRSAFDPECSIWGCTATKGLKECKGGRDVAGAYLILCPVHWRRARGQE